MTLQVHPSGAERGGGASTVDAYPLPFSVGNKEIVGADPDSSLIIREEDQFPGSRTNVVVESSNNVTVGNRTVFNGDVTIFQNINRNSLRTLHAGTLENDVECKKKTSSIWNYNISKRMKIIIVLILCILFLLLTIYSGITPAPTINNGTPIIERSFWEAEPPTYINKTGISVLIIIKHTGGEGCTHFRSCAEKVKQIQHEDMYNEHLSDIRYNFLIGGDGKIYEGRGWGVKNEGWDNTTDVAFIGNFSKDTPTDVMINNIVYLYLNSKFYLDYAEFYIVCHNQIDVTDSPGKKLCDKISSLPSYCRENVTNINGDINTLSKLTRACMQMEEAYYY